MNLTDMQVLTLVRAHPGLNLYQLEKKAKEEMSRWDWSIGKVQKSVERLKKEHKVQTRLIINGGRSCQQVYCSPTV
jgi:hypothetical protein